MNDLYSRAPHRPAASADAHSLHAALLIDFDNVTMGIRSDLGRELRKLLDSDIIRGKVSVQRAYADWRRYPQYIASLSEASIDLIFAPAYGSTKKNATDIRLAIDALEIVFIRPEIGTFILLSGDSDFSSLVLKLKEYGKYVIGVGIQESSSDLLVQNCDEYYSYNSLSGLTSASDMQNIVKHDPWELAAKAIRRMTDRGDVMRSDRFKQVMLELDPSFSEKSIGFSKFNRFLTESASRGILELQKAANGQYEVATGSRVGEYGGSSVAGSAPVETGARAPKKEADDGRGRRRGRDERTRAKTETRSGRRGRGRESRERAPAGDAPSVDEARLRAAYDLLRSVVVQKASRSGSVRDSEVKRQMVDRDPSFDEAALGFRKFSRFLRQAHDEEIITLERTGEGNYRISAGAGTNAAEPQETPSDITSSGETGGDRSRSRGRRDRRTRTGSRRSGEAHASGEAAEPEEAKTDSDVPADVVAPEELTVPAEPVARDEAVARDETTAGPRPQAPSRLAGRRRRSPGARSGQRSGSSAGIVPGPVGGREGGAPADQAEPEARSAPPGTPAAEPQSAGAGAARPADRSLGRFRRGSRGPTGASSDSKESVDLTPGQAELVERMARGYQGVGRRTAERLVEEFGDRVIEVIDGEPGRIEQVLPKGRAQAVIDGRKAEREAAEG